MLACAVKERIVNLEPPQDDLRPENNDDSKTVQPFNSISTFITALAGLLTIGEPTQTHEICVFNTNCGSQDVDTISQRRRFLNV